MTNPYLIEGPALISFSGGRTSGYLLRQIVLAYDLFGRVQGLSDIRRPAFINKVISVLKGSRGLA